MLQENTKEGIYHEWGLESLQHLLCYRNLCFIFKIYKYHLRKLIEPDTIFLPGQNYDIRNTQNVPKVDVNP